ncbi:MAG: hypothetical protein E7591_09600 [Ruminococcaceae bacterium]|nr:hypothetical protein [Oscillospiraceae bacterium]
MKRILTLLLISAMLLSSLCIYAGSHPFTDVDRESWYEGAVAYCYENSLMNGVSDTSFDPKGYVTRAQFVKALANMEGVELDGYSESARKTPFTDVAPSEWYSNAVEWARQNEIVNGKTETSFDPLGKVTRQQMAAMLERYATLKGEKTDYDFSLERFTDNSLIGEWAVSGVRYAAAMGIFEGNDKGEFSPLATATRAQLATVLQRIDQRKGNRILCYGDSLTMGIMTGFEDIAEFPYPERLGQYLGVETLNYGIGGETSDMIAMRQGAVAVYVDDITIPAECEPVLLNYIVDNDEDFSVFAFYGFEGINDCEIAGVKGKITAFSHENNRFNEEIYFVRNEPGEEVAITEPERIITHAMADKREDDILVIWSGSNDLLGVIDTSRLDVIMSYIDAMIEYAGTDEYVIVGYTANDYLGSSFYTECVDDCNEILAEKYGDKFLNVKSYLASYDALYDNGITPTERDIERLNRGWIPYSLLDESHYPVHFNQIGYDIVADMVAQKIVELGYIK